MFTWNQTQDFGCYFQGFRFRFYTETSFFSHIVLTTTANKESTTIIYQKFFNENDN